MTILPQRRETRGLPWRSALLFAVLLVAPAAARQGHPAKLDADAVAKAEFSGRPPPSGSASALGLRLQVLLARARFSPGEIDGKFGENAKKALRAYADAQGLSSGGGLTSEIWDKLKADDAPVLTDYEIANQDLAGPFLKRIPARMEDQKDLPALGYVSPREGLAEKFHMSEDLLAALNPGETFGQAGHRIVVVSMPEPEREAPKAARVEVDKSRQTVKVFDAENRLVEFYPATVGSEEKPSPAGKLRVTEIERDPTYRYNPKYRFKGVRTDKPFTIKAGPNNPVGAVWIGLSEEGYGIHGTPEPGKVSKAQSHGCVRMTNWDVRRLAAEVKKGTPVAFVDGGSPKTPEASSAGRPRT